MSLIDIVEVARQTGIPASTLRYYDEKNLIESMGRRGLRRLFDKSVFPRLSLITLGKNAGFTLDEIGAMFTPNGDAQIDRTLLTHKADQLDQTISQLTAMRDGLRHAAKCPAPSHMECPTFLRLLRLSDADRTRKSTRDRPTHKNGLK